MLESVIYALLLACVSLLIALERGLHLPASAMPVTGRRQKALLRVLIAAGLLGLFADFCQRQSLSPWLPLQALWLGMVAAPFVVAFLLIPGTLLVFAVMTVLKVRESIIERRKPNPH